MGMYMTAHVGPFVRLKLEPTTYISNVKCCTNASCKRHERASIEKFCPDCGTKIETTGVEVEGTIGWQEFLPLKDYEYEDAMWDISEWLGNDNESILISNQSATNSDIGEHGGLQSFGEVDDPSMTSAMSVFCLEEFQAAHGVMLEEMKEFFGDKMTIEYGVCIYWC
jgi:hypothetical protein